MRKLQAVPDRKLKSCCACTKLLLNFCLIGRQPDSPRKPELSWTCTAKPVGNQLKRCAKHEPAKTNHKQAKESEVPKHEPAKTNHKQAKESEVPKHEPAKTNHKQAKESEVAKARAKVKAI